MHKPIGQIFKEQELVSEYEIQQALKTQKEQGGALGQILIEQGHISDDDLTKALAEQSGLEFVDLDQVEIQDETIDLVDMQTVETFEVMPVHYDGTTLTVAIAKPDNLSVLEDLRFSLPKVSNFRAMIAPEEAIKRAIGRYYGDGASAETNEFFASNAGDAGAAGGATDLSQLEADANAGPVVKLLNMILLQAIRDRAADIHLEPFEGEFKIRYRVDGVL
ncbi:MAG: hypothetical protein AAF517_08415, partial [Planctomycetota bacterium]